MRHKLTFALASAALACGSIWGCSDDDVSPGIGGAGGSAGAGGRGGRGGTGGTPGTGGTGTATGGTSAATGGSGGTGTGTGGSGGTGTVGDSGVEPDATVDEGDASVEPDSGSPGPDGDAGLPGTDAGLASTNAFLCTENCNTQLTVCGSEFQNDVCLADCFNRFEFTLAFECQQAAVALQQCLSRAPNTWTCQPDAGATVSSTPTGCAVEIAASNSACAAP